MAPRLLSRRRGEGGESGEHPPARPRCRGRTSPPSAVDTAIRRSAREAARANAASSVTSSPTTSPLSAPVRRTSSRKVALVRQPGGATLTTHLPLNGLALVRSRPVETSMRASAACGSRRCGSAAPATAACPRPPPGRGQAIARRRSAGAARRGLAAEQRRTTRIFGAVVSDHVARAKPRLAHSVTLLPVRMATGKSRAIVSRWRTTAGGTRASSGRTTIGASVPSRSNASRGRKPRSPAGPLRPRA